MKSEIRTLLLWLSVIWVLLSTMVSLPLEAAGSRPPTPEAEVNNPQMTQEELQAAVLSYANRFIATIGQAAYELEEKIPTKKGRLIAAARKFYSLSAVTEIAAGPNPGPALLDLVVITTLNRLVWEFYWRPQEFGMPATVMVDAFKQMEADAWNMAAKVMTDAQMNELKDVILEWHGSHPNQRAVDYIRFSDFGDLGKKPNLKEIQKPGGLLAPVREATEAVDEVRRTSERAMFLLTKMQILIGFRAELIYKELVMQPEMETILTDISGFRSTANRLADLLEKLPDQVADERSAAISDAGNLIARERTAVLKAIDDKATTISRLNTDVQKTIDRVDVAFASLQKTTGDAERLIQQTHKTTVVMQDLLATVERLVVRFEPKDPSVPSRPFDINEYIVAIEKIQRTLESLNKMAMGVERTTTPIITHALEQFNEAADQRVDHIFLRLFQLLLAAGGIIVIILVVHRFTRPKKPVN